LPGDPPGAGGDIVAFVNPPTEWSKPARTAKATRCAPN
jgi:hypothetical protein